MKYSLIALLLAVIAIGIGQIGMKYVAQIASYDSALDLKDNLLTNKRTITFFIGICFLYFLSMILWIYGLKNVPLSLAYMFNAVAFVTVPLLAVLIFNESINKFYWIGLVLILSGLYFTVKGSNVNL